MDKSSKICRILWQNTRIRGGRSNSQILTISRWPWKIYNLTAERSV